MSRNSMRARRTARRVEQRVERINEANSGCACDMACELGPVGWDMAEPPTPVQGDDGPYSPVSFGDPEDTYVDALAQAENEDGVTGEPDEPIPTADDDTVIERTLPTKKPDFNRPDQPDDEVVREVERELHDQ